MCRAALPDVVDGEEKERKCFCRFGGKWSYLARRKPPHSPDSKKATALGEARGADFPLRFWPHDHLFGLRRERGGGRGDKQGHEDGSLREAGCRVALRRTVLRATHHKELCLFLPRAPPGCSLTPLRGLRVVPGA